jgi:ABC-type glycerol-3-phosphate transport system substrate-binding protein
MSHGAIVSSMRFLFVVTALGLAACGSKDDESGPADSTAATVMAPAVDTTIKTDTVKVAGDTAKMN